MTFIRRRQVAVLAAAMLAAAALPAQALAGTGGASPDAAPSPTGPPSVLALGVPTATASANGITVSSSPAAMLAKAATVTGIAPAPLGAVEVDELDATNGVWTEVATAAVAPTGAFKARWKPADLGAQQLRIVPLGSASSADATAPQLNVTVYRAGGASWYGPTGKKAGMTACGVRLTRTTVGVAHKTLPCGTEVQLFFGGRTLTVPVIDRGPFVTGRSWDLTKATFSALDDTSDGVITVGALPLTDQPRMKTPFSAPPIKIVAPAAKTKLKSASKR
ncbi:MAG TPA: septal ring lytic transglycosylase RlpA family protein [Conexibacter sp.]|jgi:hypothetical protein